IDARRLRLDPDRGERREAPGEEQKDGADAAAEVEERLRWSPGAFPRREPRRHEVVERPAMAVGPLEHAPVAGEIGEILARARTEETRIARRRGRRPGWAPSGRPARGWRSHGARVADG